LSKIYTFYSGKKTRKPTNNVVKKLVTDFVSLYYYVIVVLLRLVKVEGFGYPVGTLR